jgi:site-specific DNA-methyltransferase (adenine-specific)
MKGQKTLFSHASDEWSTPQDLFDELNSVFHFNVDVCSTRENTKCCFHFTKEDDGLSKNWGTSTRFCNPPYSEISKWVDKALSCIFGETVMLLPSRTDTKWYHKLLSSSKARIYPIKGRLKFGGSTNSAPFPSCIVHIAQYRQEDLIRRICDRNFINPKGVI